MRYLPILVVFFACIPFSLADWSGSQGGPSNDAHEATPGFFHANIKSVSNSTLSSSYDPLVGDLAGDSTREIVFTGSAVTVTGPRLKLLANRSVGSISGQPALIPVEDGYGDIAVLVRYESETSLLRLRLEEGSLRTISNTTLNITGTGGLTCYEEDDAHCVFVSSPDTIHKVNMETLEHSSGTLPGYVLTANRVPAVGDLHDNGSLQAVFWIDADGNNDYGVAAYDLTHLSLDSRFGVQDNLHDAIFARRETRGQPLLKDLDGDSLLEVALGLFYDDEGFRGYENDWFTELIVLDDDGSVLFTKCEQGFNGCNDATSKVNRWPGTNPFILDPDGDAEQDLCIIQDRKVSGTARDMSFRCFDAAGQRVHEAILEGDPPGNEILEFESAVTLDADNDGKREILTDRGAFRQDGSKFLDYDNHGASIVPLQRDGLQSDILVADENGASVYFPEADACVGTIQIEAIQGDGAPVPNVTISSQGIENRTTDALGLAEIKKTRSCARSLDITASCTQNNRTCGTKNTALDLLNDTDTLTFDCSVCTGYSDLSISPGKITIDREAGTVAAVVTLLNAEPNNDTNLTMTATKAGILHGQASVLFDIPPNQSSVNVSAMLPLQDAGRVHITLDPKNLIAEPKTNNHVSIPLAAEKLRAALVVDTGNEAADSAIRSYLSGLIESVPEDEADLIIMVGKGNDRFEGINEYMLGSIFQSERAGYKGGVTFHEHSPLGFQPYVGLVNGFWQAHTATNYVVAFGNDLEGDIAAVKTLVGARDLFLDPQQLSNERVRIAGPKDSVGIKTYDFLHSRENEAHFGQESDLFEGIVADVLRGETFESHIKTVQTPSDTSFSESSVLRFKHLNPALSRWYQEAAVNQTTPVVMSGGIFSNIDTFKDGLGRELAQEGHDVWLIEMTGGPQIECDDCPDYTYEDLATHFWPALIAGVMDDSGGEEVHYVGHSNGCRAALSSLNLYSQFGKDAAGFLKDPDTGQYSREADLPARPVDKFFGIGCPATLNDETLTGYFLTLERRDPATTNGNYMLKNLNESNLKHIDMDDVAFRLSMLAPFLVDGKNPISLSLMGHYNSLYQDTSSQLELSSVSVSNALFFGGKYVDEKIPIESTNDGAVPLADIKLINASIREKGSRMLIIPSSHGGLIDHQKVSKSIRASLE